MPAWPGRVRIPIVAMPAAVAGPTPVETLWSGYGAQGLYARDPLQRHLRDVLAIAQHFSFNFDIAGSAYGLHALGGAYANPTM